MSITIMIELTLKPEMAESYLEHFASTLTKTREASGCEHIQIFRDKEDTNRLVAVERWASREHQERYLAWRLEQGIRSDAHAAPFVFRYFDALDC